MKRIVTGPSLQPTVCVLLVAQLCLILCNPMDCRPPGSSVHRILQATTLEWVAMPFSRNLPNPGIDPGSLHCRQLLYHLSYPGSPCTLLWNYKISKETTCAPVCIRVFWSVALVECKGMFREISENGLESILRSVIYHSAPFSPTHTHTHTLTHTHSHKIEWRSHRTFFRTEHIRSMIKNFCCI